MQYFFEIQYFLKSYSCKNQKNKELFDLTKKLWDLIKRLRVNSRPKCVSKLKFCVSVLVKQYPAGAVGDGTSICNLQYRHTGL